MCVVRDGDRIVYYCSLFLKVPEDCELNNLCVHPSCHHEGIGNALLLHALQAARELGYSKMNLRIVEENRALRSWYEASGFVHTSTKKFDFSPFTLGYMKKELCVC